MLHQDSSWFFTEVNTIFISQQSNYSPDLASADLFLLPKRKYTLNWWWFDTTEEIKEKKVAEGPESVTETSISGRFPKMEEALVAVF